MSLCPAVVGGRFYLSWGDKRLECSGEARLSLADQTREAVATASGEMVVTITAALPSWELDFWDTQGADPMELWNAACGIDATVVAQDTGKRYQWTNATVHGEVGRNATTGVITGMKLSCAARNFSIVQ
jgi:hypothetical protein